MGAVAFERGLVGHWPMDERAGDTAYDQTANANDGTIHGAVFTRGKLGWVLEFDGVDDYVGTPANIDILPLTCTAWVKIGDPVSNNTNFDRGTIWSNDKAGNYGHPFYIDTGTRQARIGYHDGFFLPDYYFPINEWVHVAVTYEEGEEVSLYVNGSFFDSKSYTSAGFDGLNNTDLGRYPDGSTDYLNGTIDEPRIYDRALTESEIQDLYYYGAEPSPRHVPKLEARV